MSPDPTVKTSPSRPPIEISVVLPVRNEKGNLVELLAEIETALGPLDRRYEIIAVDDGSSDGSRELLLDLADLHVRLKVICLRRNYGQSAALDAGFRHASGELIVTLDADLQNDPADIPKLIGTLERDDLDLVSGNRSIRQDALLVRRLPSGIANWLIRRVTGTRTRDLGCGLRVYRRAIIDELHLYGEMHRLMAVVAEGTGARSAQVDVNHRPRTSGHSKYGLMRTFKVLLDLLTLWFMRGFQTKPIYVFGGIAMSLMFTSMLMAAFVLYQKFVNGIFVHLQPLFVVSMVFSVIAVQFLGMGLIAEMIVRTYFESQDKAPYLIGTTKGFERESASLVEPRISPATLRQFERQRADVTPAPVRG